MLKSRFVIKYRYCGIRLLRNTTKLYLDHRRVPILLFVLIRYVTGKLPDEFSFTGDLPDSVLRPHRHWISFITIITKRVYQKMIKLCFVIKL